MGKVLNSAMAILCCRAVWIPAAVLATATAVFWWTDADLAMLRPFFAGDAVGDARWPLKQAQPWDILYHWGLLPALLLGCGGMAVWLLSFRFSRLERWRDPGLFFALVLIVGPGIIVNVCKPLWSRPRPRALAVFGDKHEFVPVWQLGHGEENASFPSGHATTGFCLMAPAFVCWRRRPRLAAGWLALGLTYGCVIGLARIVAGDHFPSDVIWSGGIVYFTALLLAAPFRFGKVVSSQSSVISSQSSVISSQSSVVSSQSSVVSSQPRTDD